MGLKSGSAESASLVAVIPAYRPGNKLFEIAEALTRSIIPGIVVVDDGSGMEYSEIFRRLSAFPKITVLRHAVNLGKGAALKTGINFALCAWPDAAGVVTIDADGQHDPEDILKVCTRFACAPNSVVLGVRTFQGKVPLRSRLGNQVTRKVMRVVLGHDLTDTQTGLRAIPRSLCARLLRVPASGYELELEMLIAAKHLGIQVAQQEIRTIYLPGNPTSHFQPLRDSMRIYFVLLRFSFIAVLSAAIDNLLFYIFFTLSGSIIGAQVGARIAAGLFNYSAVRTAAFQSDEQHSAVLPGYLLLVIANVILSYAGIRLLTHALPIAIVPEKILTETFLFIANFAIQRDFVFTRRPHLVGKALAPGPDLSRSSHMHGRPLPTEGHF